MATTSLRMGLWVTFHSASGWTCQCFSSRLNGSGGARPWPWWVLADDQNRLATQLNALQGAHTPYVTVPSGPRWCRPTVAGGGSASMV